MNPLLSILPATHSKLMTLAEPSSHNFDDGSTSMGIVELKFIPCGSDAIPTKGFIGTD
jgi:hypothetical protein